MEILIKQSYAERIQKGKIENEITVAKEFRDIFDGNLSINGGRGKLIKKLRTDHNIEPGTYKKRKQFNIKY